MCNLIFVAVLCVQLVMATADDGPCPGNEVRRCGGEYTCERPWIKGTPPCGLGCQAPPYPCLCKRGFVRTFHSKTCLPYDHVCILH